MSGWIHDCVNGNRIVVRHGDMSGYVEVHEKVEGKTAQMVLIPGQDILRLVANFARSEQIRLAESEIDGKPDEKILGIERMPQGPCDMRPADSSLTPPSE